MTAQRLTIPEPEIELYEDGFDATDRGVADLGRADDGKKLSDLVEKITEPMVIAVDAPWGAGKSVFLKCWVGEHIKPKYKRKTTTVYFDAFASDYMDDPLIALIAAVTHRFEKENANLSISEKALSALNSIKKYAPALGRGLLKFGINIATAGALQEIENQEQSLLDDAMKSGADVITPATDHFWKRELGQKQIMESFRDSLRELAADQKLVIVVDELDRCRPDYALNLLEVIKHFFNIENVHFVLGVNLTELENSVRARYGAGVNAGLYLQKFVTVTMRLHDHELARPRKEDYFRTLCRQVGILQNGSPPYIAKTYLELAADPSAITLRGLQHFARSLAVSPSSSDKWGNPTINRNNEFLRFGLLFMNSFHPHLISRLKHEQLSYEDIETVLQLPDPREATGTKEHATVAWMLCLRQQGNSEVFDVFFENNAASMCASFDYSTLLYIWNNFASVFELTR
ncbi:P-loop NTPase fold protein [Celeribacter halophilus]|uniref:P-loop NTPase fold protein n=1 Tax=Celeribacter halophilus TaxID=576117 RepID=A0AAW7XTT4_9RHOB|nr:P-loop NTPase fold protein [Celeribacter halophilus]MDO6456384.1 P-loop NTPase fold protein [Celeribacter halophilus]MDO6722847.1 P-loop NTPase fold protein [Celeribacter halophilus]